MSLIVGIVTDLGLSHSCPPYSGMLWTSLRLREQSRVQIRACTVTWPPHTFSSCWIVCSNHTPLPRTSTPTMNRGRHCGGQVREKKHFQWLCHSFALLTNIQCSLRNIASHRTTPFIWSESFSLFRYLIKLWPIFGWKGRSLLDERTVRIFYFWGLDIQLRMFMYLC